MAWNTLALVMLTTTIAGYYIGIISERGAYKESNKALRKEIHNNYREIENLREIIFYYESRSSRHLNNQTATGNR